MPFAAIRIIKNDGEEQTAQVQELEDSALADRAIAIDVEYSDVNFKDGLCITGTLGLVETFPLTAGIDIVGMVTESNHSTIAVGDLVTVNGWGIGTNFDGGFAQKARVDAAWVTPVPRASTASPPPRSAPSATPPPWPCSRCKTTT
jgi:acrylyl-CoA reductase (NADPH)